MLALSWTEPILPCHLLCRRPPPPTVPFLSDEILPAEGRLEENDNSAKTAGVAAVEFPSPASSSDAGAGKGAAVSGKAKCLCGREDGVGRDDIRRRKR